MWSTTSSGASVLRLMMTSTAAEQTVFQKAADADVHDPDAEAVACDVPEDHARAELRGDYAHVAERGHH
eukprot:CAMPEP_0197911448 /NCGR_PEP_ID=MMETSP1439-20131203/72826_1 /TAXON_ID=66791 /ORGANISM="Gonyaulax spinifera, Strain CCMP409" /LENGTH=68 /DNA_ID=CAMNT_0043533177 /DNA_START=1 /DNA_END=203 /DNA_ORIENTATION=-